MLGGFHHSSYPTGWFQFAWAAEIAPGDVRPLRVFERDVVCYRGETGTLHVMDAHCLHFGAHLGYGGMVEQDSIRCPFHGWCWDSTGANSDIPYGSRKNFKLRMRTYPVEEVDGLAFLWFSPSGKEPSWKLPQIVAPRMVSDYFDIYPDCARVDKARMVPQLIAENTVDFPHLKWVHRWKAAEPELVDFEAADHRFTATMRGSLETKKGIANMVTTMNNYGVGLAVAPMDGLRPMIEVISAIPVDKEHSEIRITMFVMRPEDADPAELDSLARGMVRAQMREGLEYDPAVGDRRIWEHMRYVDRPPLVPEEFASTKALRQWAAQFYEDDLEPVDETR
jgi:3-ketosteroid 9alpha-monooxygenase subunit A